MDADVNEANELKVISLMPPGAAFLKGLPEIGILGSFQGEVVGEDNFRPNAAFIEYMHKAIAEHGPRDPDLLEAAIRAREGWLYIIDGRTPNPSGEVPPHDVIGGFQLSIGKIVEKSYQPNPNHRLFTKDGLTQLPKYIEKIMISEIMVAGQ